MRSRLLPLVLLLIATTIVTAQSTDQQLEPETSPQSLLNLIHQLQKRVSELEDRERQQSQGQLSCSDRGMVAATAMTQGSPAVTQEAHEHGILPVKCARQRRTIRHYRSGDSVTSTSRPLIRRVP